MTAIIPHRKVNEKTIRAHEQQQKTCMSQKSSLERKCPYHKNDCHEPNKVN